MAKIKRNDMVLVIAGRDESPTPRRVLRVIPDKNRVLVEGAGLIKKHVKADPSRRIEGGILTQERPIHISNVMLVDAEGKRTRVGFKTEGDRKFRVAKTTGAEIADPKQK
jgi:large subunit ribosomal protein L24